MSKDSLLIINEKSGRTVYMTLPTETCKLLTKLLGEEDSVESVFYDSDWLFKPEYTPASDNHYHYSKWMKYFLERSGLTDKDPYSELYQALKWRVADG